MNPIQSTQFELQFASPLAPWWLWLLLPLAGLAGVSGAWFFYLHDYQKERVFTFLDPERDPLGAGRDTLATISDGAAKSLR